MNNRVEVAVVLACLALRGPLAAQTITRVSDPHRRQRPSGHRGRPRRQPLVHRAERQPDRTDHHCRHRHRVPHSHARQPPQGIAAGPDGNLWFTEQAANQIGRITHGRRHHGIRHPHGQQQPLDIAAGPDGNLWFTEYFGNKFGRITTAGVITEFAVTTAGNPLGIAAGSDGNLWFTEQNGHCDAPHHHGRRDHRVLRSHGVHGSHRGGAGRQPLVYGGDWQHRANHHGRCRHRVSDPQTEPIRDRGRLGRQPLVHGCKPQRDRADYHRRCFHW